MHWCALLGYLVIYLCPFPPPIFSVVKVEMVVVGAGGWRMWRFCSRPSGDRWRWQQDGEGSPAPSGGGCCRGAPLPPGLLRGPQRGPGRPPPLPPQVPLPPFPSQWGAASSALHPWAWGGVGGCEGEVGGEGTHDTSGSIADWFQEKGKGVFIFSSRKSGAMLTTARNHSGGQRSPMRCVSFLERSVLTGAVYRDLFYCHCL